MTPEAAHLWSIATFTPSLYERVIPIRPDRLSGDILRGYQMEMLVEASRLMLAGHRRILLQLPTGGGKTVLAGQVLLSAQSLGLLAQFIVHRKELIDQTSLSFNSMGIKHGFIASGRPLDLDAQTILAGVQTLVNRLGRVTVPNLAIIDEAHHSPAGNWQKTLAAYDGCFVIGLTATPERLDGRGLSDQYDVMVAGPSLSWLIENGYLCRYDYYAPSQPDLSEVPDQAGDYSRAAAASVMDKPGLIGDVVEHYLRLANGKRGVVFAASIEHSKNLAAAFRVAGVRAEHVDGTMLDAERARIDTAFRSGQLDILTNVDLFSEGYDVPGIHYVGLARPTKSRSLFLQQVGRALRLAKDKLYAIICDHAGNITTHKLPDSDYVWTLEGRVKRTAGSVNDDADPIRQCMTCYQVWPSTVKSCPTCKTDFPVVVRQLTVKEGRLEKIERITLEKEIKAQEKAAKAAATKARLALEKETKAAAAIVRRTEEKACCDYKDFHDLATARGYDDPHLWARMKLKVRSDYAARFKSR